MTGERRWVTAATFLGVFGSIAVALPSADGARAAAEGKRNFYYQCAARSYCLSASTTTRHTSLEYFSMHASCRNGQSIDILNVPNSVRISRYTRRFSFKKTVTTFEGDAVVLGTVTVKGRLYPRKRLTGEWSIDAAGSDCRDRTAGTFKMRFKFVTGATRSPS